MKTAQSKDGTKIAYDTYGTGPALVYITGASCFRSFTPVVQSAKTFAQAFTVYNYDRRGRGDSDSVSTWSVEREVEDIEALIDAAGGKAYVYGHSSGAVLALEAAMRLGDKVQKVVLYDASYSHDQAEQAEYGQLSAKIDQLLARGKNAKAMKTFLRGIGMPAAFVAFLPLFPGWRTMKNLAPTLAYDIALTKDLPPVDRIAKIKLPIFISVGQKSPAALHDVAKQLQKALPQAAFAEIAGQDHMVDAKTLLPKFVDFLK